MTVVMLQEGVGYFLGGHTYQISDATAASLIAAGYVVTDDSTGTFPGLTRYPSFGLFPSEVL